MVYRVVLHRKENVEFPDGLSKLVKLWPADFNWKISKHWQNKPITKRPKGFCVVTHILGVQCKTCQAKDVVRTGLLKYQQEQWLYAQKRSEMCDRHLRKSPPACGHLSWLTCSPTSGTSNDLCTLFGCPSSELASSVLTPSSTLSNSDGLKMARYALNTK